jgi:rare lipoprotein A
MARTDVRRRTSAGLRRISATLFVSQVGCGSSRRERSCMKTSVYLKCAFVGMALVPVWLVSAAHAEMASVYGGRDGYCGSRTANGERVNCSAMTAAHRRLPFGTRVRVCHSRSRCVTVRINDRGPFVRGRDIDLSPAAARAIGLGGTGSLFHGCEVHHTRSSKPSRTERTNEPGRRPSLVLHRTAVMP